MRRAFLLATLLVLNCSLGACSPKPLSQVRAQVRGWTGGNGQVEFLSDDLKTLSRSTIDNVGRFTLALPDEAVMQPLLQPSLLPEPLPVGCQSTVKVSRPARFYTLGDITAYPLTGKNALTLVSEDQSSGAAQRTLDKRVFLYASAAAVVQGNLMCPVASEQAKASYRLNLKTGWNHVMSRQVVQRSGASTTTIETVGDDGFEGWQVKL